MYKLASLLLLLVKVSPNPVYINDYYPAQAPAPVHASNTAAPVYIVPYEGYYGEQDYVPVGGYSPSLSYSQAWERQPPAYYGSYPRYPQPETPFYYFPALPTTADPQTNAQSLSTIRDPTIQSSEASLTASSTTPDQSNPQTNENVPTQTVTAETPTPEPPTPEEPAAKEEELKASSVSDDSPEGSTDFTFPPFTAETASIDDSSSTVKQPDNEQETDNTVEQTDNLDVNERPTHEFAYDKKHSLDRTDIAEFDEKEGFGAAPTFSTTRTDAVSDDSTTASAATIIANPQTATVDQADKPSHSRRPRRHRHVPMNAESDDQTMTSANVDPIESPVPMPRKRRHRPRKQNYGDEE